MRWHTAKNRSVHRIIVLYEAAGLTGDVGTYLIRSLLSEGRICYETVEKTKEGLKARRIEREGPYRTNHHYDCCRAAS